MSTFIFLDIESTGMDARRDKIIEVACIKWQDGKIIDRFESLVNPGIPVPHEIVMLTGITDEEVKNAPDFSEVREKLQHFIGDLPIVGHNIMFDTGFLRSHQIILANPEIDTLALARILLRKESSYALEVLMKKHGLKLRASHRAMADTETTLDFFEFLLNKLSEISPETWKKIEAVLEKTSWHGKTIFSEFKYGNGKKGAAKEKVKDEEVHVLHSGAHFWQDSSVEVFFKEKKVLLESNGCIPLKLFKEKLPLVIAYATNRKRNELQALAHQQGLSMHHLAEPSRYLSPTKLHERLHGGNFTAEETPFLLKLLLWCEETETGNREEITLERDEYSLFDMLADHEGSDIFWKKAMKAAQKSELVLLHQCVLGKTFLEDTKATTLIITEGCKLEDSFTQALRKKYTEKDLHRHWGEKATMIFGMLGIFYEKHSETNAGGYRGNVILNEEMRATNEWQRFMDTLAGVPALGGGTDDAKKEEFMAALAPGVNSITWVCSFADELQLIAAPPKLSDHFATCIKPYTHVLIQSEELSDVGKFSLTRTLFGLGEEWKTIQEEKPELPLNLMAQPDFPDPYDSSYLEKCLALFKDLMLKNKGRTLFLMSSKKHVELCYRALLPFARENSVQLIGCGPSGGVGKTVALFLEKPNESVLLSTQQIIPYFEEIGDHIDTVVFQKIPFDSPDDPLVSARIAFFKNGFAEYTLPRAVTKFRELLVELSKSTRTDGHKKTCFLLDSRLLTKDYGMLFL